MDQLLVALDVDTRRARAASWPTQLRGAGRRLQDRQPAVHAAKGPALVQALVDAGIRVFLDLKFHDIPNTVAQAVEAGDAHRRLDDQRARVGRRADDAGRGASGRRDGRTGWAVRRRW